MAHPTSNRIQVLKRMVVLELADARFPPFKALLREKPPLPTSHPNKANATKPQCQYVGIISSHEPCRAWSLDVHSLKESLSTVAGVLACTYSCTLPGWMGIEGLPVRF